MPSPRYVLKDRHHKHAGNEGDHCHAPRLHTRSERTLILLGLRTGSFFSPSTLASYAFEPTTTFVQTSQLRPPRGSTYQILGILHVPPTYTAQHVASVGVCVELGDEHIRNHCEDADVVFYAFASVVVCVSVPASLSCGTWLTARGRLFFSIPSR